MLLEQHYEIRRIVTDFERRGAHVVLNLGILYKDSNGKQVGPPSRLDITLNGQQFTRANPNVRLTINEDVVLAAAKTKLESQNVTFLVPAEQEI